MNRLLTSLLLAVTLCPTVIAVSAQPAHAAARITVTNDRGGTEADLTYRTTFTLRGSGFQSVRGGFGGVYVAFGWVRDPAGGSWKPSRGGATGHDYRYVPDAENANNAGFLKFVAFPGSSTAGEAHAVMSAQGSFTVDLAVPGPVFTSTDRNGNAVEVDCRTTTCGVITIGAHGVKNPSNETFTPVQFGNVYGGEEPPSTSQQPGESDDAEAANPDDGASEAGSPSRPEQSGSAAEWPEMANRKPRLKTDRRTAIAGHAMAFTARGFAPGEQVVAVLDDGTVSLGPLQAGVAGEVAGVISLPATLPVGTHELRLKAAASNTVLKERFAVQQGPENQAAEASPDGASLTTAAASIAEPSQIRGELLWPLSFVAVAAVLFGMALIRVLSRRRNGARAALGEGA